MRLGFNFWNQVFTLMCHPRLGRQAPVYTAAVGHRAAALTLKGLWWHRRHGDGRCTSAVLSNCHSLSWALQPCWCVLLSLNGASLKMGNLHSCCCCGMFVKIFWMLFATNQIVNSFQTIFLIIETFLSSTCHPDLYICYIVLLSSLISISGYATKLAVLVFVLHWEKCPTS